MPLWAQIVILVLSTVSCGVFFSWIIRRLDRLRQHEHRQNNAMTRLILESSQHADDLAAIRQTLGIPR